MKQSGRCPKCGSSEIKNGARPCDQQGFDLQIKAFQYPTALVFKGRYFVGMSACVCVVCGFVELYVDDPGVLANDA